MTLQGNHSLHLTDRVTHDDDIDNDSLKYVPLPCTPGDSPTNK